MQLNRLQPKANSYQSSFPACCAATIDALRTCCSFVPPRIACSSASRPGIAAAMAAGSASAAFAAAAAAAPCGCAGMLACCNPPSDLAVSLAPGGGRGGGAGGPGGCLRLPGAAAANDSAPGGGGGGGGGAGRRVGDEPASPTTVLDTAVAAAPPPPAAARLNVWCCNPVRMLPAPLPCSGCHTRLLTSGGLSLSPLLLLLFKPANAALCSFAGVLCGRAGSCCCC